ncbi:MAG: PQQ-binding-like beta-propeller repeat protein [Candidatus Hydrogenedentes bacterium]|nr:PQQ-binding-like beta-propeller repeat protein [Candidatus Hydrogenedentota bacterium]
MKPHMLIKALAPVLCVLLANLPGATAQETSEQAVQTGPGHHFAAADYTGQKVFLVNADGEVEWEYETGGACNDIWVLPNGNLLFNTGTGVTGVNRDKEIVFRYASDSEIYACQPLANGNTFIAECNSGRLLEVDPAGAIVSELRLLPEGEDGGHIFMRNARKLVNGNYLVAHSGQEIVREYAQDGTVVKEFAAPGGPHSAIRLPDGNTLITCGDMREAPMVLEVDPDGREVWKVAHDELPGISLKFVAGVHRLPNGNTVLANWVGRDQFGQAPHLIEVTRDKEVVWTFQDHKTMKTISSVQILDVPGNPLLGEVLH